MIPRCYPVNDDGDLVVALYEGDGKAWIDYIPIAVQPVEDHSDNSYNDDGAMHCDVILDTEGYRKWADYVPVLVVDYVEGKQWRSDDDGFIPVHDHEGFGGYDLEVDSLHIDGTRMTVTSVHNGPTPTEMRVQAPTAPVPYQTEHRFIYVLPCKPDDNDDFGDGFDALVNAGVHNLFNATIIAPEFHLEPYIADHPTDEHYMYETFMVQDLWPWVRSNLAQTGTEQHWLISFSKGGWSVINLLLRNPTKFQFAALFDPIIEKAAIFSDLGSDWSSSAIGTEQNYDAKYDVVTNIAASNLGANTRIAVFQGPSFGDDSWDALIAALDSKEVPYFSRSEWENAQHHWSTNGATDGHTIYSSWPIIAADAGYHAHRLQANGTLNRKTAAEVEGVALYMAMDEGAGSIGVEGSDAGAVSAASVTGDSAWDTHEYSGEPVVRSSGDSNKPSFGAYTALGGSDRTIALWARVDAYDSGDTQYAALIDNEANEGWSFFVENNGRLNYYGSEDTFAPDDAVGPTVPTGCWRLVGMTWDNTAKVVKFYVDGELTSTVSMPTVNANAVPNGNLILGAIRDGGVFQGTRARFGSIYIYDRVLSDSEMRSLF